MISDTLMTSPSHGRSALLDGSPSPFSKPAKLLDLHAVPTDEWLDYLGDPVAVPAPLQHFLRHAELLTDCALDLAEFALERHYGITLPWRLVTDRGDLDEDGNRMFTGFYLHRLSQSAGRAWE